MNEKIKNQSEGNRSKVRSNSLKGKTINKDAKTGQTQLAYDACKYDIHYQCIGISSTHTVKYLPLMPHVGKPILTTYLPNACVKIQ